MTLTGILEYIKNEGMQRHISVSSEGRLYLFNFLADEWDDEDRPEKYPLGTVVSYPLRLESVSGYEIVDSSEKSDLANTGPRMLEAFAVGKVAKRVEPSVYLLDLGQGGELPVHFIHPTELHIGSRIKVVGVLAADQNWD